MSHAVSIDLIKARLHERIDSLVPQLFPNARKHGREWVLGDVHGAPGSSMSICAAGAKVGIWADYAGTARGDVIDLVAAGACDGDVKAAIGWARDWLGLGALSPEQLRRQEEKAARARERAQAAQEADSEKTRRKAKGLWLSGEAWEGSPVERYMLGRAVPLAQLAHQPRSLRYHGRVWCREAGGVELPAMLAPVVDAVSGDFLAVHRTWLACHPDGRVTKAALADPKKSWGSPVGGLIALSRGASGKPIGAMPAGEWIGLSEGVENGLSAALIRPELRVAAAVTLRNLGEVHLPAQCGGVIIIADNDAKAEAIKGFEAVLRRLEARRIAFEIVRPPVGVKDFNDWLQALARQNGRLA